MTKTKKIRLTPALFHILLSLAEGEKHGYGIMLEVRERTDGSVKLGPGSLYWALDRLEEEGLISEIDPAETGAEEERRKYYCLTETGKTTLSVEAAKLADIVDLARERQVI
jgi:DNA-binding PadR family transcriptional regulator